MANLYNGLVFETALLAQWAAFFDLEGWSWQRGIAPIGDWKPDYRLTFSCPHSECGGSHTILISVLPVKSISTLKDHPALEHVFGVQDTNGKLVANAGALFGSSYNATTWVMSHGAGGGVESIENWVDNPAVTWERAARLVKPGVER